MRLFSPDENGPAGNASTGNASTGDAISSSDPDLKIQYQISDIVKEAGYGLKYKERTIQVVKNKYDNIPDPVTNETNRQLIQPSYVIDSANKEIDQSQNYLDKLDDVLFKMLADAHVLVLDKAGEKRYIKVLEQATNTKQLPAVKK